MSEKIFSLFKKVLIAVRPRFSFHYVAYTSMALMVAFSIVSFVFATTPNPGHPWAETGDGTFIVTGPTVARTFTLPDANATILTSNALVTVAQGGIGVGTLASNGVLYGNGTGAVQALAVNAGAVQCLTQASSAAPTWGSCGGGGGDMVLASVQTITGAKTFGTIGGAVGKLIIAGATSGSTILDATPVAGSGTVTLPTTGTLATLAGSEAFTNKTYNGNTFTAGTGVLTIAASKTLTASNTLTLAGTDGTTMTFPSTSAAVLTNANLVTVAQGGIGVGTLASNGVLYGNGTGAVQALAVNSGATLCLTQATSAAPTWGSCGAGGAQRLDQIIAATTNTTINSTTSAIRWDWALTGQTGFTIGENTAATGSSVLNQITTLAGSTAKPLQVTSAGTGDINFNLTSTGDLTIQDNGVTYATFSDTGGVTLAPTGTTQGLIINNTGTGNSLNIQQNSTNRFTVGANGGLTINGTDSSIVRETVADFALGTVGSNLSNATGRLQLSDGTPVNSGTGTITTGGQTTSVAVGAGALTLTRADGKYLIIHGGNTLSTTLFDPVANTMTASQTLACNGTTNIGVGALALPKTNGTYVLICANAGSVTATSIIDPMGAVPSLIGPPLVTNAITVAGTVAYKRPDGKYIVTVGGGVTTQIFDPAATSANFAVGPPATGFGNFGAGALVLPLPDGRALFVSGGSASTTAIYNPYSGSAVFGAFTSAGPSLDGNQTTGTCGINGAGSVALKRQDGKYVILSKISVSALYDPSANTMTCRTSNGPSVALGDGAHAIPLQNGKFLIFGGGVTTNAWIYSQDTDSFATYTSTGGSAPSTIGAGAHSIMRTDGTWQIITGNASTATNTFNTALPMSDPFPVAPAAAAPTSGGSCTNGLHSYYVTFITGGVESELSQKSNIVDCNSTLATQTVALSGIPIGPVGTTARKIYRTTTGDTGLPKLLDTTGICSTSGGGGGLTDNTTTTCSDTTADASLGATYSITNASTWYKSEDISNSYISNGSTLRWVAQLEAAYSAQRNGQSVNSAFKVLQFFVKTAVNGGSCATSLAAQPWQEIQNSGDSIRPVSGANCIKVAVHFNRAMPKKLQDDRGTWTGNNTTVLRYDYTTPALFSYSIDNSAIFKKMAFDFSSPTSSLSIPGTIPTAATATQSAGGGTCTAGVHFWFVTFVTGGVESQLGSSATATCVGGTDKVTLTNIPLGPSGTTARKIYRTAAALLVSDTPFLVTTLNDNSTVSYVDGATDASLGVAYSQLTPSGPTLSRGESSRVESVNNQLTLPYGRMAPSQATANTIGLGNFYMGAFGNHPNLNNPAGIGTFVIARDDKTFLVVEGSNTLATADLYDPATSTFINQTGTGNVPTAAVGTGGFAIKRPNGKFLIVIGGGVTTTNIYDQYAPAGSRFTIGPPLSGNASFGAFSIQNTDGTFTILHGGAVATSSLYDPVRNTMTAGPVPTTGAGYGALAIPLAGPMNNNYKIITGATTVGGAVTTTTMNYNANTKVFLAGAALTTAGSGSGGFAFQRADGYWILVKGSASATTSIINPYDGVDSVGPALTTSTSTDGAHVIPRADGTFLLLGGNVGGAGVPGTLVTSNIYFPWGGAMPTSAGSPLGQTVVGPTTILSGSVAVPATLTIGVPSAGGSVTAGVHFWRYSNLVNGVESPLSVTPATFTVVGGTQTVPFTNVPAGPTGTTARKIYRTLAGASTNSVYYYVGQIADNSTLTFTDTVADPAVAVANMSPTGQGAVGDGALSFQRPDGKWVTIFAGSIPSETTNIYDAGWYADGQYLSEEMQVPALAANSTLDWQQTPDQYVRMAVRTASTQAALGVASYTPIASPGGSIGNAGGETWAQVQVNFRRDFPTFGYNLNGVYNSSGGMTYNYRTISMPTVNSYQITNGMNLMDLQDNGLSMLRVTSDGNIMSSINGGFFSGGADLAENYTSTQSLIRGEVVIIDPNNSQGVLRSTGQYQNTIVGVVSTAPGFVAGSKTISSVPIALVGRVPVKFSTENGPIKAGDYLTSSSIPGYAMRATQAGRVIGTALENMDTSKLSFCPSMGLGQLGGTKCGTIVVFVNLASYSGASIEMLMQEDLNNIGQALQSGISAITDPNNFNSNLTLSPNVSSGLTSPQLASTQATVESQILDFLKRVRDTKGMGQNLSEIFTDRVAASMEIITPQVFTDGITLNTISSGKDAVSFMSDTIFFGRPYFTTDTAGFATIAKGEQSIDVVFDKEYIEQPIVNATITLDDDPSIINETDPTKIQTLKDAENQVVKDIFNDNVSYMIVHKSVKGFTVILKDKAVHDLKFSWISLAVKGAKTWTNKDIIAPAPTIDTLLNPPKVPVNIDSLLVPSLNPITPVVTDPVIPTSPPIDTTQLTPDPVLSPPLPPPQPSVITPTPQIITPDTVNQP